MVQSLAQLAATLIYYILVELESYFSKKQDKFKGKIIFKWRVRFLFLSSSDACNNFRKRNGSGSEDVWC